MQARANVGKRPHCRRLLFYLRCVFLLCMMSESYLKQTARKLNFWGILAPLVLITLSIIIAAREGVAAAWTNNTIPVILGIALIIFVAMRTVAYALDYFARQTDHTDDC